MFLCVLLVKIFVSRRWLLLANSPYEQSNRLYCKSLGDTRCQQQSKIGHITVRNIELFFCFCKLENFFHCHFSVFTGYLLPLQSGNLTVQKALKALSLLCSLFLLAARHSANKFALCSRSAASVRGVRGVKEFREFREFREIPKRENRRRLRKCRMQNAKCKIRK